MQELALPMGRALGLSDNQLDELALLAALHDIGKIAIAKTILTKPGKLSPDEWAIMKKHPEIGYRIAMACQDLIPIAEAILAHHERWDGAGYPQGLRGENIPLVSRIISVIDAYDVITNGRVYQEAASVTEAIDELHRCAGTQFDPALVDMFAEMLCKMTEHGEMLPGEERDRDNHRGNGSAKEVTGELIFRYIANAEVCARSPMDEGDPAWILADQRVPLGAGTED